MQSFDNHLLAAGQAGVNHNAGTIRAAYLDSLGDRFAVFDNEHVDPRLVGDERRLRNYDPLRGLPGFNNNGQQLPIDNASFGIGNGGAR